MTPPTFSSASLSWLSRHLPSWLILHRTGGRHAAADRRRSPSSPSTRLRPPTPHPLHKGRSVQVQAKGKRGHLTRSSPRPPFPAPLSGEVSPAFAFSRFVSPTAVASAPAKGREEGFGLPSPSFRTVSPSTVESSPAPQACPLPPYLSQSTSQLWLATAARQWKGPHTASTSSAVSSYAAYSASPSSAPLSPLSRSPLPFSCTEPSSPHFPSSPLSQQCSGGDEEDGADCRPPHAHLPPLFIPGGGDAASIQLLPPTPPASPPPPPPQCRLQLLPWRLSFEATREVASERVDSCGAALTADGRPLVEWWQGEETGSSRWIGRLMAQSPPPAWEMAYPHSPLDVHMLRAYVHSGASKRQSGRPSWLGGGMDAFQPLPFPSLLPTTQAVPLAAH